MRQLRIAEIKGAWLTWVAVSCTFVATGYAVVLPLMVFSSVQRAIEEGLVPPDEQPALLATPWFNLPLITVAALTVVSSSAGLVIEARRNAIARVALAGATPRQVTSLLVWQLAVVATLGAVVGAVLSALTLEPVMGVVMGNRGVDGAAPTRIDLTYVVIALVAAVLLGVLGGWRQARKASKIPPVEALRPALGAGSGRRRWGRYVLAGAVVAVILGLGQTAISVASSGNRDSGDIVMQLSLATMLLLGTAFAFAAPVAIGLLTRAWTALIPATASASWHLARQTVLVKRERLARSVVPVMFAVGVVFGMSSLGVATNRAMDQAGMESLGNFSIGDILVLVGLTLLVALGGGLSSLIMMSRQREAESALASVVGATPRQQVLALVFEAVMITVTATILGLLMAAAGLVLLYFALDAIGLPGAFAIAWPTVLGTAATCLLAVTAAVVLPALGSLRRPAPMVISQLVAE